MVTREKIVTLLNAQLRNGMFLEDMLEVVENYCHEKGKDIELTKKFIGAIQQGYFNIFDFYVHAIMHFKKKFTVYELSEKDAETSAYKVILYL